MLFLQVCKIKLDFACCCQHTGHNRLLCVWCYFSQSIQYVYIITWLSVFRMYVKYVTYFGFKSIWLQLSKTIFWHSCCCVLMGLALHIDWSLCVVGVWVRCKQRGGLMTRELVFVLVYRHNAPPQSRMPTYQFTQAPAPLWFVLWWRTSHNSDNKQTLIDTACIDTIKHTHSVKQQPRKFKHLLFSKCAIHQMKHFTGTKTLNWQH